MYSDSRKAQRNSFAHHRAELLFSMQRSFASDKIDWSAPLDNGTDAAQQVSLVRYVRASLLGSATASAAAA